jgi:hypothetical protein
LARDRAVAGVESMILELALGPRVLLISLLELVLGAFECSPADVMEAALPELSLLSKRSHDD